MGQITIDQSHQVLATLAVNTDWTTIDFADSGLQDLLVRNPKEAGRQFTMFLKNGGKIDPKVVVVIKRNCFDPKKFFGDSWSILNDETDARSIALTDLYLTKVQLVTMLDGREKCVGGEERLRRLKASDYIRLDADVFLTFWENQHLIPKSWKEKVGGDTQCIHFDGTILLRSDGRRYVLYLYWSDREREWNKGVLWLDGNWGGRHLPSAVLAN